MKRIDKRVTFNPWRPTNGPKGRRVLTQDETYQLEKKCLTLLDKNYKCICNKKSRHFPVIQDPSYIKLKFEYTFSLSYCGECLDPNYTFDKNNHSYKITNLDEQLSCIISNLKKSNIKHLDMHPSGKNLCISSSNILSVIDFGVASVNNHFLTPYFLEKRKVFGYHYYVGLKKKIAKIVKEKNLLPNA